MIKKQIPNLLTLCNLICGALAAYMAVMGWLHRAAMFMMLGIVFDFLDGFAARMLGVSSPVGKELDSLADVVTSGVAPAFILFRMLMCFQGWKYWALLAFLMPAFAAYRLAKFNLDERQHESFLGLPVPSNALIWASLGLCVAHPDWAHVALLPVPFIQWVLLSNTSLIVMACLSMLTNVLMVSEVPMLKREGIISGGMIPKIDCCVEAVRRGVSRAYIIDGRIPHSILIEMLTAEGIGTMFY